ncbi:PAS domain S-box protein [Thauera sp.]|uniref:PAS domain S-box protein n=1 Tax=Thauera sp. TaxID=1905334 RepID=UPI0039E51C52
MDDDPNLANLHHLITGQMADALIYADCDGIIRVWNAAAEALFGFPAPAAIGQSLDLIIPEKLRAAHWTGYDRALAAGATRLGRRAMLTRALNQAGQTIYVEMSFAVVADPAKGVLGSVAVARDGTTRRELELARRAAS